MFKALMFFNYVQKYQLFNIHKALRKHRNMVERNDYDMPKYI